MTSTTNLNPQTTLRDVLAAYLGAQRALFKRYHIGGCSSCAFQPDETLEQLCARNGGLDVVEMIEHIQTSHEQDEKILIVPKELARLRAENPSLHLLDVRTREEHEAVRIEGSVLMSQTTMQEVLGKWPREELFVIYDHEGKRALDAAAYFAGHGFQNVRCLRGGIDAWSQEVEPELPRYNLG
ncbi:MAG: rhodanese-like domain-containing protein [Verrucomicrobia bacterium]|nr:rhodanese-like domain-containing protein [Verrucomicrobiota bacterium]